MNKEHCEACHTPYEGCQHPIHHPEGRPHAWVCDLCWFDGNVSERFEQNAPDLVNEPPHYKGLVVRVDQAKTTFAKLDISPGGGKDKLDVPIESIELRRGFEKSMGFSTDLTDALKYLYRCDKKGNKKQDLEKCIKSIQGEIDHG